MPCRVVERHAARRGLMLTGPVLVVPPLLAIRLEIENLPGIRLKRLRWDI